MAEISRAAPPIGSKPPCGDMDGDASSDSTAGSFLGIPARELTPNVRRAVTALLGEARALHEELGRTRAMLEDAEQIADRDHLLPLLNRRAFVRVLEREIASIARYGAVSSLIYFDLDGFKRINDANGHACGDAVLAHFADLLLAHVRQSDVVGRLGGDEFGIILVHANAEQAERKAASLAEILAAAGATWNSRPLPFSFSSGVLELTGELNADSAIARADAEMYLRKRDR